MAKKDGEKNAQAAKGTETGDAVQTERAAAEASTDFDAAHAHAVAGRIAQAEAICRKILASDPSHAEALHLLGGIAAQSGNAPSAIELFNRALAAKPDFAKAQSNLGIVLLGRGEAEQAVDHFEKAIESQPAYAEAHNNLGNALMRSGRFADAKKAYARAVKLEPENVLAYNNLGAALLHQGRADEAIAQLKTALQIDPTLATAHNNLGSALQRKRDFQGAAASFRRALELRPDLAQVHSNLGAVYMDLGRLEEALACHEKALQLKPSQEIAAEAHRKLGIVLEELGRYDEAEESLNRAIDLNPDDTQARYNHATVHKFVPGDPEIAKLKGLLGRKGMSEDQRNPLLFALGKAHDDIRLYAEAFSYYRQANDEKARRVNFSASRHRKQLIEIKGVFRDQRCSASGSSVAVEQVPIFVVGISRSGKTLVESLLSQHEDAYGAKESHEWSNAIKAVLDKHSIPELFPNCMASLTDDHIREIGRIYMGNLVENSPNSKLFIDTMLGNYLFIGMILQALPMAKIIYCHRDPIDNCLFVYFYRYARGNYHSYDLSNLASYYADYQDLMAHWQRLYGDRILSVRYEDLVRNPAETGAGIYEYCGLDYDATAIRAAFTTDEIAHWKHYEPYLGTLRQALGGLAQGSMTL